MILHPPPKPTFANLIAQNASQSAADRDLAARYAPILQFDANEPFLPLLVGYTIFRESADSASFPRRIELNTTKSPATVAIEYAIWWDWDIQHLYELEHVWVYLDDKGNVIQAEASWHGGYSDMAINGTLPLTGNRLTIFSEPGKHAFAPCQDRLQTYAEKTQKACTRYAGSGGVWITPLFQDIIDAKTPTADRLVHTYLERHAFQPSMDFTRIFSIPANILVPWSALFKWIPNRIAWWVSELDHNIPHHERRFLRIAHRGASHQSPPNTPAAIAKAAELKADMVELDVQMSADGVPVVAHSADIQKLTGKSVSAHTLNELKALDLGAGETVPTLDEAIRHCTEHNLGIYFDLKGNRVAQPVTEAIQKYDLHRQTIVGSFRPDWLVEVSAIDPNITTSILFNSIHIDAVALAHVVGATYVHPAWEKQSATPHTLLTPEWINKAHTAGLGVISWHEERPSELAALRTLGIDGICTDDLSLLA